MGLERVLEMLVEGSGLRAALASPQSNMGATLAFLGFWPTARDQKNVPQCAALCAEGMGLRVRVGRSACGVHGAELQCAGCTTRAPCRNRGGPSERKEKTACVRRTQLDGWRVADGG